jgi:hypothetical protein
VTLILTAVSPQGVVQASDRLVSAGGVPVNPLANKTVIFCAQDAFVVMSYTGLAMLDGLRTDDWMARKIVDMDEWVPGDRLALPGARIGMTHPWHDLGTAVQSLRDGLTEVFSGPERRHSYFAHVIALAGWQWDRASGRGRAILWVIEKAAGSTQATAECMLPRNWLHTPEIRLLITPGWPEHAEEAARQAILERLAVDLRPEVWETVLTDAIRDVSAEHPGAVGPHTMTVAMPLPQGNPSATTCYRPSAAVGGTPSPPQAPFAVAYYPWMILGDRMLAGPGRLYAQTPTFTMGGGGAEVEIRTETTQPPSPTQRPQPGFFLAGSQEPGELI